MPRLAAILGLYAFETTLGAELELGRRYTVERGYMATRAWCYYEPDAPQDGAEGPFATSQQAIAAIHREARELDEPAPVITVVDDD